MNKIPRILLVTPVLEPGVDLLAPPVPSLIIPCNWEDRGEFYLHFSFLNQLSQCPEVSLNCPCACCNFYCCQPQKSVMDNNARVVPGSFLFTFHLGSLEASSFPKKSGLHIGPSLPSTGESPMTRNHLSYVEDD